MDWTGKGKKGMPWQPVQGIQSHSIKHSESTENDNKTSTVHGSYTYLSVSSANGLTNLEGPNQEDARQLFNVDPMCISSLHQGICRFSYCFFYFTGATQNSSVSSPYATRDATNKISRASKAETKGFPMQYIRSQITASYIISNHPILHNETAGPRGVPACVLPIT